MQVHRLLSKITKRFRPRLSTQISFEEERIPELRGAPIRFGPVRILSTEPPIFLSGISYDEFVGIARSFGARYGNIPAGFIIFPTWSIENARKAAGIREAFLRHASQFPNHRFRYICNTQGEAQHLKREGQPALFLNHKFTVSEHVFRPLGNAHAEFDAIYNARFVREKRHELACEIDNVAFVTYVEPQQTRIREFQQIMPRVMSRNPRHHILNEMVDTVPVTMSHAEVNAALNRASTGLILSEVEGASYAAMEYLLSGLPIVSTKSIGGRDIFFDPEYCLICDSTPQSVREAVEALKQKGIPRSYIRERTLRKIEPERRRFLALIDDLLEELGSLPRHEKGWSLGDRSGVPWKGFKHHLRDFELSYACHFEKRFALPDGSLDGVQLTINEIKAVAKVLRSKPGQSLLVFGCGNDSVAWETINREGLTAFVEDDPEWASQTRQLLRQSAVHLVSYNTRLDEWKTLLNKTSALDLNLPREITSRKWDVILVDGPAGHTSDSPGRMKSIYAASNLVGPNGKVFIHDCERHAEAAYATRFLDSGRVFVEVRGRALLRGYAF